MKANKTESQKKASKKEAKKALEQSLTTKLFEAVKSLGHDAEKIGEDLILVSKFVAKKIAKRVKTTEIETPSSLSLSEVKHKKKDSKIKKSAKSKVAEPNIPVNTKATADLQNQKAVVQEVKRTNPVVKATKPIETAVKKTPARKTPAKKTKSATNTDKKQVN